MHCGPIEYKFNNNSEAECTNYPGEAEPLHDTVSEKFWRTNRSDVVTLIAPNVFLLIFPTFFFFFKSYYMQKEIFN